MRNRSNETPENYIWRQLAKLTKWVEQLKAAQINGADNMPIELVPSDGYLLASSTVSPGSLITFAITALPGNSVLTLWNFLTSLYVDVDGDDANLYGGIINTLTANQKNLNREEWIEWAESSDISNSRVLKVRVKNNDSGSHVYHLRMRGYLPKSGGGGAS